jgi:hypothetical protein
LDARAGLRVPVDRPGNDRTVDGAHPFRKPLTQLGIGDAAGAGAQLTKPLPERGRIFPRDSGDKVRRVVLEPRVGGQHYEDWGDGSGHLYGQVTVYDPPTQWATRGRVYPGTILDTSYELTEETGGVRVRVTKLAVGPMTEEEAAGIAEFGDFSGSAAAIEKLAAG